MIGEATPGDQEEERRIPTMDLEKPPAATRARTPWPPPGSPPPWARPHLALIELARGDGARAAHPLLALGRAGADSAHPLPGLGRPLHPGLSTEQPQARSHFARLVQAL